MSFADQLTVARAISVPIVVVLFAWPFHAHDYWATGIFIGAMWTDWLDPGTTKEADVRALLDSMPEPHLVPRVVSDKVNYVRNNGPELIEAAA